MRAVALVALIAVAVAGCAAEEASGRPAEEEAPEEAPAADAAAANAAAGRDTSPFSCLAACQNASLTCSVRGAAAAPASLEIGGDEGCSGEITRGNATEKLTVDCNGHEVCAGSDCASATFSATAIAWGDVVCVRD